MILVDAILEALSYAGLLSGDLVPEEKEDRRTTILRCLLVMALLMMILLPLYFAFR
jgi:hypothetical protein